MQSKILSTKSGSISALALTFALALLCIGLCGCGAMSDWFKSGPNRPKIDGERLSVLASEAGIKSEADEEDLSVIEIPDPYIYPSWTQAGGNAAHNMGHLHLASAPQHLWQASLDNGASDKNFLLAEPVIAAGSVFTSDTKGEVCAFALDTGKSLWCNDLGAKKDNETLGGAGLAFLESDDSEDSHNATLFATTGAGDIIALAPTDGKVLWQINIGAPIRTAPTLYEGKLFILALDNRVLAINPKDGSTLWSYNALPESTVLLGSPALAAGGKTIVAAFSSGEIFVLKADNGVPVFSDTLTSKGLSSFLPSLLAVKGRPVLDDEIIFASSAGNITTALSPQSGERVWEKDFGSENQLWLAGDYLFAISSAGEALAMDKDTGRVLWLTKLPYWQDEEEKEGRIFWYGPVLAGNRLIVTSSSGALLGLSPTSGDIVSSSSLTKDGFAFAPIVADETIITLDKSGKLRAYK